LIAPVGTFGPPPVIVKPARIVTTKTSAYGCDVFFASSDCRCPALCNAGTQRAGNGIENDCNVLKGDSDRTLHANPRKHQRNSAWESAVMGRL
jgi:hypothetical protein